MATVLFFASAREAAGTARISIDGESAAQVVEAVCGIAGQRLAELLPHCSVMVDGQRVTALEAARVDESSEVAILPPVSGGCW